MSTRERAQEFIRTHGQKASDVMTSKVITVAEEVPLHEIARLLEQNHIKRVPVTKNGELVGIVSRANLLQGLAAKGAKITSLSSSDDKIIRETLLNSLSKEIGITTINVIVTNGVVELWGFVSSAAEKRAAEVSAENTPGVKSIENNLGFLPAISD